MITKLNIKELKEKARNRAGIAIAGAFALVIALSWNEAIKEIVDDILKYLGVTGPTYYFRIIAALFTTLIGIVGIMYFSKWTEVDKK